MTAAPPRVALVTGGAVRLGAAITRRLSASGWQVCIHAHRNIEAARALAAALGGVAIAADLGDPAGADALADAALAHCAAHGARLGALINNAASFERIPALEVTPAAFAATLQLNLVAPFRLAQRLAPALRDAARPGAVVNLLDISALRPYREHTAYSAAKAGLQAVTAGLAAEWAPHIRVNGVAPGAAIFPEDEPPALRAARLARTPLGRETGADAVADAVAFLVDGPPEITGIVLPVDGGRSAAW